MNQVRNPFKATLGATPPLLVGRADTIEDFGFALDDGVGAHERISLVVGPRGIGKTVLLNAFEDAALERGWLVISETATAGFVDRIRNQAMRILANNRKQLSGLNLSILGIGAGASWDTAQIDKAAYTLRDALKDLLAYKQTLDKKANQATSGLLITVDEMHHQRSSEVTEFGATIQHLVRENEEIAVAMAGILSAIRPLLASTVEGRQTANPVTFLRRANRIELGRVSDSDVRDALRTPVENAGMQWKEDALDAAVVACQGYPFMIQLVGQSAVRKCSGKVITHEAAKEGISLARRKLGQLVHEPALADLSDIDRTILVHMSQSDGPSKTAEVAEKMKRSASYVGNYRRRLIDAEMIVEVRRGVVDFALPYLRDYLREHAASLVADSELD